MKYVKEAGKRRNCFICEAAKLENYEEKYVLFKGKKTILLMNLYPYNTGHLLAAPLKHVPSIEDLSDDELAALFKLVSSAIKILRKAFNPDGFNVGVNLGRAAGAGLEEHVHVHIVPRWVGDTNFMPVVAETKVLPEALPDTYRRLRRYSNLLRE